MDKNEWGGSCCTGSQEIIIGVKKDRSDLRNFNTFIHEVIEAVTLERKFRFDAADGDLVFVMNHKQFGSFCTDIATAIWPMIKKEVKT